MGLTSSSGHSGPYIARRLGRWGCNFHRNQNGFPCIFINLHHKKPNQGPEREKTEPIGFFLRFYGFFVSN